MRRVERGRVDALLQVRPEDGVRQVQLQRPLVLPVTAGDAEGEVGLGVAQDERRGHLLQNRPRRARRLPTNRDY